MLFVLAAASLTILLMGFVFLPALRGRKAEAVADEHAFDLTVYKQQLRELEADIERGAIPAAEADYARAEMGRRLLAAQDAVDASQNAAGKARQAGAPVLAAAAVFAPLATILVYTMTGSPGMDSQPLATRVAEMREQVAARDLQDMQITELVARAEAHLNQNPDDGRGWDVLAPMYLRLGRAADARNAFERSIAIQGESAARRSGLGQAYYMLAGGLVDANARVEFVRALEIDAGESRARFFMALAAAQSGDEAGALRAWQALVGDPNAAPEWQAAAAEGLRRFGAPATAATPGSPAPQLDAETMRDAEEMSAEDRSEMIAGMVAQLDAKLRDNPDDLAGWQRLIRSYLVLGRETDAREALERALAAFAQDEAKRDAVAQFAATLGLASGGEGQ
ncbi:c-type cytochrome biogenesis protein CcmI [Oricola sp.]|uniref:c-type cytochrome biogenesis protein CcmI n=1 Tax=Oricola sp. TaxID=1979950 RepID=UPI0025F753DB|nr:c-type cytochrome biogenesis protein CcmI [Oricola sp.]MCI5073483.1 c-type cytochrome biogenesis protein CcmI [Oricola sp.]